jgi:hypothetical protein
LLFGFCQNQHPDEYDEPSPYEGVTKAGVLMEIKAFNQQPLDTRLCCQVDISMTTDYLFANGGCIHGSIQAIVCSRNFDFHVFKLASVRFIFFFAFDFAFIYGEHDCLMVVWKFRF